MSDIHWLEVLIGFSIGFLIAWAGIAIIRWRRAGDVRRVVTERQRVRDVPDLEPGTWEELPANSVRLIRTQALGPTEGQ